jgi:hypothetical protein
LAALSGPDVRHVSASFNAITSYSTTKTFSVKFAELSAVDPHISTIQSPSGIPVRKVVMGDYHTVACDHAGAAFAWGENTAGQLGRGEIGARDVGALDQPTVIHFGRGDEKDNKGRASQRYLGEFPDRRQRTDTGDFKPGFQNRRFVFDVAAGGWQCGALVVDMRDYCPTGTGETSRLAQSEGGSSGVTQPPEGDENLPIQEMSEASQAASKEFQESPTNATKDETAEEASTPLEDLRDASHDQDQDAARGVPLRRGGLPFIRFGYAARGGVRGGSGFNMPRREVASVSLITMIYSHASFRTRKNASGTAVAARNLIVRMSQLSSAFLRWTAVGNSVILVLRTTW